MTIPTLAEAWQLHRAGRSADAAALAAVISEHEPHNAAALRLLGTLARHAGDAVAAADHFARAIAQSGPTPDGLAELGEAQLAANRNTEALGSFARALELRPRDPAALRGQAQSHLALGNHDAALTAFRHALAVLPYDKYVAHMAAALAQGSQTASSAYVAELFDTYAGDFDAHLTGALNYRIPERIRDLLAPYAPASLLDLGCGTGLVAAALKERIAIMDGIDLAPQMIRRARERELYRHLRVGDIARVATDPALSGPYDLVTAADVFVYLGSLEPVFATVLDLLSPRGLFAFSVEASSDEHIALRPSGRFAHASAYIDRLVAASGFVILEALETPIRQERGQPIPGRLYLLQRR